MDMFRRRKVEISDEDRAKSYAKYYDREPVKIPPAMMGKVFGPPMPPMKALAFTDRNTILDSDGKDVDTGYIVMPDGTGYITLVTEFPGGTPEMIDWWFAWRGLDALRYVILDPYSNVSALTMQSSYAADEDRTLQEKYWDTTHVIKHAGFGALADYLNFKCPSDVGFDMSKIGPDQKTKTLVCGRNYAEGEPPAAAPDYFICHQVFETAGGIKVVTRIWYGWTVRYGLSYKALPDGFRMQPMHPQGLLQKQAAEWANLAALLPGLYAEEKDNF